MIHFKLDLTCWCCPEQYDVYLDGNQVGYLRLRHGYFRCDYLDCGGETLYSAYPKGDSSFEDDERDHYLRKALAALLEKLEINEDFDYKIESERYNDID